MIFAKALHVSRMSSPCPTKRDPRWRCSTESTLCGQSTSSRVTQGLGFGPGNLRQLPRPSYATADADQAHGLRNGGQPSATDQRGSHAQGRRASLVPISPLSALRRLSKSPALGNPFV
ncbi:hypothetical protein AG1IA_10238 [Rhizoctonia solani AG-1 IA]|uniref:Uncharacterized protein n=1 Tax=Thanatephorus cucumeris (strain AG1-IA) TaxID=983506 RepID=L8WG87_THACA|nr:hypothetical protein AG1IA_10238 [Rhizoctonia solani AG-1 IA]